MESGSLKERLSGKLRSLEDESIGDRDEKKNLNVNREEESGAKLSRSLADERMQLR